MLAEKYFYDLAMESKNIVGRRIVKARREANPRISQKDLIARLEVQGMKVDQSTLSKIEHGQRLVSDKEVVALARALKVSVAWLLQAEK
jgi:transcriptional regulator with XRE-family HTH domain